MKTLIELLAILLGSLIGGTVGVLIVLSMGLSLVRFIERLFR